MSDLEKYFLEYDNPVLADDNYITDGALIISKDTIANKFLRRYKNAENLFNLSADIPYDKGEEFYIGVGSECILIPNNEIVIKYDNKYGFTYKYLKLINKHLRFDFIYFTVVINEKNLPILKIFGQDDNFLGCLAAYKYENNSDNNK